MDNGIFCRLIPCAITYHNQVILEVGELSLPVGKLIGLIGNNGSGKTTLLRTLVGLEGAGVNKVHFPPFGPLNSMDVKQRVKTLAFLPSRPEAVFNYMVQDFVSLGRFYYRQYLGESETQTLEKARFALKMTNALHLKKKNIHALSDGELKRVNLARLLVTEAQCFFMDEPLANLDLKNAYQFMVLLKNFCQMGKNVVLSLHDLGLAKEYCDWLVCLDKGKILEAGNPASIINRDFIKKVFEVELGADI